MGEGTGSVDDGHRMRGWAWAGLVGQIVFVAVWLLAAAWQPSGYSVLRHSISDMYAVTAPHGWVLVVLLTLCGVSTIGFAWFSVRPALRRAGRRATVGVLLLSLSIFGLGDLLSPFERLACQRADPACSAADQLSNTGGMLDGLLSTVGVLLCAAAGFVLASAMRRVAGWARHARSTRIVTAVFVAAFLLTGFLGDVLGLGGLFERLLALTGALGIGLLAGRQLAQPSSAGRERTGRTTSGSARTITG